VPQYDLQPSLAPWWPSRGGRAALAEALAIRSAFALALSSFDWRACGRTAAAKVSNEVRWMSSRLWGQANDTWAPFFSFLLFGRRNHFVAVRPLGSDPRNRNRSWRTRCKAFQRVPMRCQACAGYCQTTRCPRPENVIQDGTGRPRSSIVLRSMSSQDDPMATMFASLFLGLSSPR
jgi:hypothetical protein